MVWMKNLAKATAPAWVCWVASSGISGGRSPARTRFGPVVGTSAGRVGWVARGGPGGVIDTDPEDAPGPGVLTGAVGAGTVGPTSPPLLSQALTNTAIISAKGMNRARIGRV